MQADKTSKPSPRQARLAGLGLFLALSGGMEWLLDDHGRQQAAALQAQTAAHGEKIRARLEGALNTATALSDSLAGYWAVRAGFPGPGESRDILAWHYRRSRHVRGYAVADGYRVVQVFPQDDADQALGQDYREQAAQWPAIQRGIASRSAVLEGPAAPALAMAYRVPVFLDGQYRGLLSTQIDGASLLAEAGFAHEDYQYALRTADAADGKTLLGSDGLFGDPAACQVAIAVPGGDWRLAVKAKAFPASPLPWPGAARVLGWLLAGLLAAQSTALLALNRKLAGLALYDRLTGLPSRHLFLDRLKQMLRRAKRGRGRFSVLFVDLDEFKAVNAAHGEKVGDMMLAGIGKRLIGSIRHCDSVTRWGGDEFVILLDACPQDQARLIGENLRHKIELPVSYGAAELRIGAALGLATFPEDGHSLAALLKAASARMRKDKARRKGVPDSPPQDPAAAQAPKAG